MYAEEGRQLYHLSVYEQQFEKMHLAGFKCVRGSMY